MKDDNGKYAGQQGTNSKQDKPWLKPYQFKKGQSGNPAGRPPGRTIGDELRRLVTEADSGKMATKLAEVAVQRAERGDFRFWNAIIERLDGRASERIVSAQEEEVIELLPIVLDGGRQL